MASIEELAYIAGIIDGEGYIGIARSNGGQIYSYKGKRGIVTRKTRRSKNYCGRVTLQMCDKEAIDLVHTLFNGHTFIHVPRHKNHKSAYLLYITKRTEVTKLLTAILPYLRVKKRQAKILLSFNKLRKEKLSKAHSVEYRYGKEEEQAWLQIKMLNRRGTKDD